MSKQYTETLTKSQRRAAEQNANACLKIYKQRDEKRVAWGDAVNKKMAAGEPINPFELLGQFYTELDETMALVKDRVPCKAGCAHCCRITVAVSRLEAEHIALNLGVQVDENAPSTAHNRSQRTPCPFLSDGKCRIYQYRPARCRNYVSYFETPDACSPKYIRDKNKPTYKPSFIESTLDVLDKNSYGRNSTKDIRDWFPPQLIDIVNKGCPPNPRPQKPGILARIKHFLFGR